MGDRHALVTGASHGLGEHLATTLAARGWAVTGVGRRPGTGAGFDYLAADLSTLDFDPGRAFDLVVHCAVAYPGDSADLDRVFRVNALAPYRLTQRLLAAQPDRFCCHVMVNSEAIFGADRRSAPYAASKAALRVLAAGLADSARGVASVATLLLGPLASADKRASVRALAARQDATEEEVTRLFLRRSNPNLVIDDFIDYDACVRSVEYLFELGPAANGMLCRLDGGSAGSLI